jgi:hypothetical protein
MNQQPTSIQTPTATLYFQRSTTQKKQATSWRTIALLLASLLLGICVGTISSSRASSHKGRVLNRFQHKWGYNNGEKTVIEYRVWYRYKDEEGAYQDTSSLNLATDDKGTKPEHLVELKAKKELIEDALDDCADDVRSKVKADLKAVEDEIKKIEEKKKAEEESNDSNGWSNWQKGDSDDSGGSDSGSSWQNGDDGMPIPGGPDDNENEDRDDDDF